MSGVSNRVVTGLAELLINEELIGNIMQINGTRNIS
jgi:hypothetical protein